MKSINGMNVPETKREKLKVLKEARKKLEAGFLKGGWFKEIDGLHSYCLYGALEAAMGLDFHQVAERSKQPEEFLVGFADDQDTIMVEMDKVVSGCSLTETLFAAAKPNNEYAKAVYAYDAEGADGVLESCNHWILTVEHRDKRGEELDAAIKGDLYMFWKTRALQEINDKQGKNAVLEVMDKAIADLSKS